MRSVSSSIVVGRSSAIHRLGLFGQADIVQATAVATLALWGVGGQIAQRQGVLHLPDQVAGAFAQRRGEDDFHAPPTAKVYS